MLKCNHLGCLAQLMFLHWLPHTYLSEGVFWMNFADRLRFMWVMQLFWKVLRFVIVFVYLEGKQFPIVFSRSNKTHCETSTLLYLRIIVSASQYNIVFSRILQKIFYTNEPFLSYEMFDGFDRYFWWQLNFWISFRNIFALCCPMN